MSIPPKYGRVYTRINGRVSCKAITFPFLRFRCAHEGKGASQRIRERKREGGQTQREREKEKGEGRENGEDQNREREIGKDGCRILYLHVRTLYARDFMREPTCIATIERPYQHL